MLAFANLGDAGRVTIEGIKLTSTV